MKISIITVVRNNEKTIRDAMESVLSQDYRDIEYIVIDGASNDGTMEAVAGVIRQCPTENITFLSEKDQGMYDAMNKGIKMASGDIIGILNSDDFYADSTVISRVVENFKRKAVDCIFADMLIVGKKDTKKIVRYYRSEGFSLKWFALGNMPAHPTVFLKRAVYDEYGFFKIDYKIAADFELLTRFFVKGKISYYYMPEVLVYMRGGGRSTNGIQATYMINKEILRACKENGIKTNIIKVYSKYLMKIFQFFLRPSKTVNQSDAPRVRAKI